MHDFAFCVRAYGCLADLVHVHIDGHTFMSFAAAWDYLMSLGFTFEEAVAYTDLLPSR